MTNCNDDGWLIFSAAYEALRRAEQAIIEEKLTEKPAKIAAQAEKIPVVSYKYISKTAEEKSRQVHMYIRVSKCSSKVMACHARTW